MKYSLESLTVLATVGPPLLAGAAIVAVGGYDFLNDPVPLQDGGTSPYKPVLPLVLSPIAVSLLVAWVVLGSIVGKRVGQRSGEVIGALAGAALTAIAVLGYIAVNS